MISQTTFTAIDFESAGTATGRTDAPIQIGTATWSPVSDAVDTWVSYIFTDKPITWAAQKVHGITKEDLAGSPKMVMLWPQIKRRLMNRAVVAHGHGTEKRFLRAFPGHAFGPWIDTLPLARAVYPELTDYSLSNICDSLQLTPKIDAIVPDKTWHDALYDATASVIMLEEIITSFGLTHSPVECLLQPDTSAWKRNRQTS